MVPITLGGCCINSGIMNWLSTATISQSTVSGNYGAGIVGFGSTSTTSVSNSTISGNRGGVGVTGASMSFSNSTVSDNGGGIVVLGTTGKLVLQNSIVSNNSGGNCSIRPGGTITSHGHNLSSDATCNFHNTGDRNNTDPMLGPLQDNGGPTQTMALPPGSPAIDAGNPSGCTDSSGHLLTKDQR